MSRVFQNYFKKKILKDIRYNQSNQFKGYMTEQKNWGGAREGSGRPKIPGSRTQNISLVISKLSEERIEYFAKKYQKPKSTIAAMLLQVYLSDEYEENNKKNLEKILKNP